MQLDIFHCWFIFQKVSRIKLMDLCPFCLSYLNGPHFQNFPQFCRSFTTVPLSYRFIPFHYPVDESKKKTLNDNMMQRTTFKIYFMISAKL